MLKLINVLAVIIGLATGFAGLWCAGAAIWAICHLVLSDPQMLWKSAALIPIGLAAGLAFIALLIASRALLHLRHPDAGTARDMIGTAIYLIVMSGVLPLGTKLHAPGSALLAVIGLYVLHRYLVKRVATRAFPADAATPTSTTAA